jgi:hypothetical protein
MSCCASSPFASSHLLSTAPIPKTVDLADPNALERVARARAYRGELILFSFDFCGISEALSLIISLRRASFEHFLPLTDGIETCDAMRTAARLRDLDDRTMPCYFSSWPRDHAGWKMWGHGPACVSAARPSHSCVLEQLWTSRYAVAGRLLALGQINLLHMDTDSAILADPYAVLKTAPLAAHNLIFVPELPINGGMWYAQNTTDGGPSQWIIAEVARRTLQVISLTPQRRMLPPFDQAMLGDVLYTAADRGTVHWGAACEHMVVRKSVLCTANTSRNPRMMRWDVRHRGETPILAALVRPHPACTCSPRRSVRVPTVAPPTAAARAALKAPAPKSEYGRARLPMRNKGIVPTALFRSVELRVPGTTRVERAATTLPWLFPNGWKAQQLGLFARRPAAAAVVHLLGVRCRWCESSEDVDHGSKWEWQHLAGFWPARAYTLAPLLASTSGASATATAAAPRPPGTAPTDGGEVPGTAPSAGQAALSQSIESSPPVEFGTIGSPLSERVERHCRKRGRARLLYADRRVLSVSRKALAFLHAEGADDDGAAARTLIRQLIVLASVSGRMAVLPSFNCSAPWIQKVPREDGSLVLADLRVVIVDAAEGRPIHEQRCAPCNVQFACRQHVLSEAQWRAAQEATVTATVPQPPSDAAHDGASAGVLDSPTRLPLPLVAPEPGAVPGAHRVVHLPQLWALLATHLGTQRELQLEELGDVRGDACSLDGELLKQSASLAATVVRLHCGVAEAALELRSLCPRTDAETRYALGRWGQGIEEARCPQYTTNEGQLLERRDVRAAPHPMAHSAAAWRRSLLAARLGVRCGDMLCSDRSCDVLAVEECAHNLRRELAGIDANSSAAMQRVRSHLRHASPAVVQEMVRERCTVWIHRLPKDSRPRCDALTGQCLAPPRAFPGRATWPSAICLEEPPARMCFAGRPVDLKAENAERFCSKCYNRADVVLHDRPR